MNGVFRAATNRSMAVGCFANYHQEADSVLHDCGELVRLIADPRVMRDRDPSLASDGFEPFGVGTIRPKVITVPLDAEAGGGEDLGKGVS